MYKYSNIFSIKKYLILLGLILTYISLPIKAESCQFITSTDNSRLSSISAYALITRKPTFTDRLLTVSNPDIITVSENNKFVIVTSSQTGDAMVYSVSPTCILEDTGNRLSGGIRNKPMVVLQHYKYLYVLLADRKRIEVFNFDSVTGKIAPAIKASVKFIPLVTFMAYNSTDKKLYISRAGGITVLNPEPVQKSGGGYTLKIEQQFEFGYTPRQIQTFGKLLFALKPFLLEPYQDEDLFVASYAIEDSELSLLSKFKVVKDEYPINFLVTHTVIEPDSGLKPEYLLFITSGNRLYSYDLLNNGTPMLSPIRKLNIRYYTPIIASTWNANLTEMEKNRSGSYFRVSLIEPALLNNNPVSNLQTIIMQIDPDKSKDLDLVSSLRTENVYNQHNMVIVPAPIY